MLDLTCQERKVVLFLISIALIGAGVDFAVKMNTGIEKVIVSENIAKININLASLDDLINSGVVTQKLAQKIIEYRDNVGSFGNIKELKEVKGIGEARLEKIEEIFFVE